MKNIIFAILAAFMLMVTIGNIGFYAGRNIGVIEPTADDFMTATVMVEDSVFGQDPVLHPDRTIHQSFRGRWTAEVNTASGEYVCSATDQTVYTPDSVSPETVRLFDWWMLARGNPEALCLAGQYPLPVGCYYVDTVWEATNFEGQFVTIFNRSNEFCVRARQEE